MQRSPRSTSTAGSRFNATPSANLEARPARCWRGLWIVGFLACWQPSWAETTLQTFTLDEVFGVDYPDEIVDFDLEKPVDAANCCLVAPNGTEAPFQLLEGGKKIAFRTALPASRLSVGIPAKLVRQKDLENYLNFQGPLAAGDVVRVAGRGLPGGLKPDRNYFVADVKFVPNVGAFASLSETLGGPILPIAFAAWEGRVIVVPFQVDVTNNRVYARAHGLRDGDPVSFRSEGTLPAPLKAGAAYAVCNSQADTFQLLAGPAKEGEVLRFLDAGTGIPELHVTWTWTLKAGHPPKPDAEAVQAKQDGDVWEVSNGLTGIRFPASQASADPLRPPAPVQGVRLADGTWTGNGPNLIHFIGRSRVLNITTRFVESGPLKVVAELTYELDRAQSAYGKEVVCPAGPGKYVSRIEMQSGQPSVLFEEETDCQFAYSFEFKGITLNQARWRGHSSNDKRSGYRLDGKPVNMSCDAIMDLPFDADYQSSYVTNFHDHMIRWISPWDIWIFDSGHYWMLYDKDGGEASPVLGIYDGRASRLRDAGACGVGVHTLGSASGGPSAGITVQAWQRGPDARLFAHPRFTWRLFVGRKKPDLREPGDIQPIGLQMNLHSGIGLNKIHRLSYDFEPASGKFGALYMSGEAVEAVIRKTREDRKFYEFSYAAVSYYRDMIDMWRDDSGDAVHAMADALWAGVRGGLFVLVHRQGIYGFSYWNAGLDASRSLMRIDQVLASAKATESDRAKARQAAVFYGAVLRDDDHAPLSVPAGVNLGTANMPVQQQGYRDMYTLFLAKHPMMAANSAEMQKGVVDGVRAMLHGTISESGAHMGSTHYIDAAMGPLLSSLQQIKQCGLADLFKDEPRLKKYAEFEMNFSTPPDPRFAMPSDPRAARRVRPSIGDACPGENTEFLGQLATGFADSDPALSARLMGLWRAVGKPESDFHGATILKIDERLPEADPRLTSAHFEGWYSAMRFGWNTRSETAAWFVNGNWYRDHASCDLGEAVIYALSAPLSLDFGTMYSPSSPGGFVHSVVLPEASIGGDWKQNPPDATRGPRWGNAKTLDFKAGETEASSQASFTLGACTWTRTMKVSMLKDDLPAIGIRDEFTTGDSRIFLLNLMNEGPVQAPDGPKYVGDSFAIPAGVTRLRFTGQAFPRHPAGGIDWDLYVVAEAPQEAFLARYEHKNVMPERQTILRLKGTGRFQVVIVAFNKGSKPPEVDVTLREGHVVLVAGERCSEF